MWVSDREKPTNHMRKKDTKMVCVTKNGEEYIVKTAKILHKQLAKNAILSHITFVWPTFITVYACLRDGNIPD